jgi:hypothetical protein
MIGPYLFSHRCENSRLLGDGFESEIARGNPPNGISAKLAANSVNSG